jgi:3-phosphoshikimate 1-carboxyvinyltransferase
MAAAVPDLVIRPQKKPLVGLVPVPSDKSITHRAILLAAIAEGGAVLRTSAIGDDNRSTLDAVRALGATVEERRGEIVVGGRGLLGLTEPAAPIDCGNSGTTMRLLAGLLAGQRFRAVLRGDASLSRRPMQRVAAPLRLRGARIEGTIDPARVGEITAPLDVGPLPAPHVLSELLYDLPIASAQVKSAILLSGLFAAGKTTVSEPTISRDHTERMLASLGVPIARVGPVVELDGPAFSGSLPAFEIVIPGDPSAAAFLCAAGLLVPGSEVGVRGVGINPTRMGFVDLARLMGAPVSVVPTGEELGEPVGDLRVTSASLRGIAAAGETVVRAIDEVPITAALAACARGTTTIADAAELRVKESDRIAAMAAVLRGFGVECEERPDGLVVEGRAGAPLRAADVDAAGDHRIAMSASVLGLVADGETRIRGVSAIATSFPRFAGTLRALGADIRVVS